VSVYATQAYVEALRGLDLAEICITSAGTITLDAPPAGAFTLPEVAGVAVTVGPAPGEKCQRCWRVLPEVGSVAAHPDLCQRCADAVDALAAHNHAVAGRG
jgi:isoleucyl-tRNA synthetase